MNAETDRHDQLRALTELRSEFVRIATAEGDRGKRWEVPARAVVLVAVGAVATAIAVAVIVAPLESPGRPTSPVSPGSRSDGTPAFVAEGPVYGSVKELVLESDLIVISTVTGTVVGDTHTEGPEDDFPTRLLHTTVRVEESLKGEALPDDRLIVRTDELAFVGPGVEDWREPGTRVLLFLTPSREQAGLHILANLNYLQTAYLVSGDDIRRTVGGDVSQVSQELAAMSTEELREAVRASP